MSREIKFRAFRNEDHFEKKWFYSQDYKRLEGFFKAVNYQIRFGSEMIVSQYTGLKDKNGKEIYESDLVRTDELDQGELKEVVIWEKGSWKVKCLNNFNKINYPLGGIKPELIEIIGNIYETPELIENI